MILESIRLKNIKCYGKGPEGQGVTVHFAPGINRIAGRNGDGKTTLIEALGFALFGAKPAYEENFKAETYLLRAGEKSGEIGITFQHGEGRYHLEVPVGTAARSMRIKVVDLSDGSICAEDERPVRDFLSRLFGMTSPRRLEEMFERLIGVKQGRLTWPFDLKRKSAADHFEPLLDVKIFSECFDRLKPSSDQLGSMREIQRLEEMKYCTRLESLNGAAEALATAQELLANLGTDAAEQDTRLESARAALAAQEALSAAARTAQERLTAVEGALRLAEEKHQRAADERGRAESAAKTLTESEPAHAAWEQADAALRTLQMRQEERTRLLEQRSRAAQELAQSQQAYSAVQARSETLRKSQEDRAIQLAALTAEAEQLKARIVALEPAANEAAEKAERARNARTLTGNAIQQLPRKITEAGSLAADVARMQKELAAWDRQAAEAARKAEEAAAAALQQCAEAVTEARTAWKGLNEQLKSLRYGICPLLKETCRQFDPARVQEDLHRQEERGNALAEAAAKAEAAHKAAVAAREQAVQHHHRMNEREKAAQADAGRLTKLLQTLLPPDFSGHAAALEALLPAGIAPPMPAPQPGSVEELEAFAATMSQWWQFLEPQVQQAISTAETRVAELQKLRQQQISAATQAARAKQDSDTAIAELNQLRQRMAALTAETGTRARTLTELDEMLKAYAGLDARMAEHRALLDTHAAGHKAWLGAREHAARLPECTAAALAASAALGLARTDLELRRAEQAAAAQAFDPAAREAARQTVEGLVARRSALTEKLAAARAAADRELQLVQEAETAASALAGVRQEISRLIAARDLVESARRTLRAAAPLVAQHLCSRIAARAQQIVNRIGHETLELEWNAESWSLRIEPGQRRFAMLSGGEQTKLALAMTLSMISHFCTLGFCLFDEPTYGVDADSRRLLADSIIAAHEAAGFQQLLLVSHDDAFEGRIEHTILLRRTAGQGTQVVEDA